MCSSSHTLQGLALFQRRQQEVATLSEVDSQRRKRSLTILRGVQSDDTLSPDDKVLFAETLREVGMSCDNHMTGHVISRVISANESSLVCGRWRVSV